MIKTPTITDTLLGHGSDGFRKFFQDVSQQA